MNASEFWTEAIEKTGQAVMLNTPDCVIQKMENKNCENCDHRLGCSKLGAILEIQFQASMYKPRDFEDQLKTNNLIATRIEKILATKTVEEIKELLG
jgi:hypothetical protein